MSSSSSSRRKVVYGVAAALVAAVALVVVLTATGTDDAPEQRLVPFTLEEVREDREPVALVDFRGRPVVVNFFAAWCVPCREELPLLEATHKRLGDEVAFVGIDTRDSRSQAQDLLRETGVTFPAGYDPKGVLVDRYRLGRGLPATLFLDADGVLVQQVLGQLDAKRLDAAIDETRRRG